MKKLKLIQIVRRYGPVGGMERYVWEVTKELSALGHEVTVLCERCYEAPPAGVTVYELGELRPRPRWLAYLRFSWRVGDWLSKHASSEVLIQSNERTGSHDVTTFHGPPFAHVRERPWWRKLSIRIAMQLWMERRELRVARAIVPNSEIIAAQLAHYYPEYADKITAPVVPGVQPGIERATRSVPKDGGVLGFVGREWQRKGLPLAVEIAARMRRSRPELELRVVGPAEGEIAHLFSNWPKKGYRLLGWRTDSAHFAEFDVLLHPASAEPYGMVISEAMSAKVPVVVSDACGAAAQVTERQGAVVELDATLQKWCAAVEAQLSRSEAAPGFVRGWDVVAREYETIYALCAQGKI